LKVGRYTPKVVGDIALEMAKLLDSANILE